MFGIFKGFIKGFRTKLINRFRVYKMCRYGKSRYWKAPIEDEPPID